MPYTNGITDQVVQYPNRFKIDGVSRTIEPDFGIVSDPGTSVNRDLITTILAGVGTTSGTAEALTLDQPGFVLQDGAVVRIKLHTDMAAGATLNVQGTGAKAIKLHTLEEVDGSCKAGVWVQLVYSSANDCYILQGGTPYPYVIFGVAIDLTNSNPETAVTYTDDAVGMNPGSAWNSMPIFKDIKPCVLKNGVVQYYLNPNDLTKKADGTSADITSGNDGDVMIEIPKTGFKITTSGNTLTIKVTENPNDTANFKYYAHTRSAEGDRSKLYIGAYLGWNSGGKLRSLSGKTPTGNQTIGTFRNQAQANGAGYDIVSFYPLTLLQCLFLIKYKNRDSQTALGRGYVDGNSAAIATGGTNAKGIDFGETSGKQQMCFLNIEDMWGNLRWFIDGLFSDANRNMLTAFTGFNDTGSGYTNRGQGATDNIGNHMSKPQGTTETGFIAKEVSGSATTHFTDYASLDASCLPYFGGHWNTGDSAGVFFLNVNRAANTSYSYFGARLMYL